MRNYQNWGQINERLIQLTGQAIDSAESGGEWVAGEGMNLVYDLCRETVRFGMIQSWTLVIIGLLFIPIWFWVLKASNKIEDEDGACVIKVLGTLACLATCGVLVSFNLTNALKSTFAPKLYVLEQVKKNLP